MNYLVAFNPEKSCWRFDTVDFIVRLQIVWPDASVRIISDREDCYSHDWEIPIAGNLLEGSLYRDGTAVALDGPFRDCASFALWVRAQVPPEVELVFTDMDYSAHMELTLQTTMADIEVVFEGFE